jgi:competence protein ComEC
MNQLGEAKIMKQRMWALFTVILCIVSIVAVGCGNTTVQSQQGSIKPAEAAVAVHFIDVGQGDAILIKTPQKTILIDSGDIDQKEKKIVQYIKNQGIKTLDVVIATHPHADHIGGMQAIFDAFTVKQLYDSGQTTTSQLYKQYLVTIKQKKIPFAVARTGENIDLGDGIILEVLAPREPLITGTNSDLNNNSLVTRLVYGKVSFLLTGDIEKEAESVLIKQGSSLKSTVLKVPHHGSNTSSSSGFIKAVKPEVAIISCGINNDYHHPHPSTLKKYEQVNTKLYRTDINGSVVVTTDGEQFQVKVEK